MTRRCGDKAVSEVTGGLDAIDVPFFTHGPCTLLIGLQQGFLWETMVTAASVLNPPRVGPMRVNLSPQRAYQSDGLSQQIGLGHFAIQPPLNQSLWQRMKYADWLRLRVHSGVGRGQRTSLSLSECDGGAIPHFNTMEPCP